MAVYDAQGRGANPVIVLNSSGVQAGTDLAVTDGDAQASVSLNGQLTRLNTFNGATWDRLYGVRDIILLASASRTTTQTSSDIVNYNHRTMVLTLDVTVIGTGSITPFIQIKDANGLYFTIWTAASAIIASSTKAYLFTPGGAAGSYTEAVNLGLSSRAIRVIITANNANPVTYSAALALGV